MENETITPKRFGVFFGKTVTYFTKAVSIEQVVPHFIRKAIEEMEGIKIEKGKEALKEAIQKWTDGYGETMIDNQKSDTGKVEFPIVSSDEAASHLANSGWLVEDDKTVNNTQQYELITDYFNQLGIKDYEYVAS